MGALPQPPAVVILHVEDSDDDAYLLKHALKAAEFPGRVLSVGSGEAAINYLCGKGRYADRARFPLPTMVLLDLRLPGMHGFELLKWIRKHPTFSGLPVVLLSVTVREADEKAAQILGVSGFWKKPFDGVGFGEIASLIMGLRSPSGAAAAPTS